MRLKLLICVVVLSLLTPGCSGLPAAGQGSVSSSGKADARVQADTVAKRANLSIVGVYRSLETTIPQSLDDLPWVLYQSAAKSAGYDFTGYRGTMVRITGYSVREKFDGMAQRLWVVRSGDQVIGAYVSVDEITPGIFGLDEVR